MQKRIIQIFMLLVLLVLLNERVMADDANIYKDATRKFSVEIPKGWEALSQHSDTLVVALIKRMPMKPFNPSIIISFLDAPLSMPENKKQLKAIVQSIAGPSGNVPNIENFKVTRSALDKKKGEVAFYYGTTYDLTRVKNEKDRRLTTLNYIFREKNHYIALSLVTPTDDTKNFEKIFWPVVGSFTLSE